MDRTCPGEPPSGNAPPNFGDFTQIDLDRLGDVELLIGGTPCQAFSIAGQRRSLTDARGNLTLAYVVLAHELARSHGLRNCIWENVPGVLNTDDNAFGCFLGALVGHDTAFPQPRGAGWPSSGMADGPRGRCAWRVLDAQYFGLAQRRERVFVVADFGDGADPAAVLFERASLSGNSSPRREPRKGVTGTLSARTRSGGGFGTDFDLDGGLVAAFGGGNRSGPVNQAATLTAKGQRCDFEVETFIAHTLRAEGFDASEDGTGRGTPLVPVAFRTSPNCGAWETGDRTEALTTGTDPSSHVVALAQNTRAASDGSSRSYLATNQPFNHIGVRQNGEPNANSSQGNTAAILRALREEIGAEAFTEWGLGISVSFQPPKVLRTGVHGGVVRRQADEAESLVGDDASPRAEIGFAGALHEMRCAGRERRAPQGWGPSEQRSVKLGEALSLLSHAGASANGFLFGLWEAAEGLGILRKALSEVQEVRRPVENEGQPAHTRWADRRLTPREAERLQGVPKNYADCLARQASERMP